MIVFYGKAKVGIAFQELCNELGKECILMDDADKDDAILDKADVIVPTPGVRQTHEIYTKYASKIVSELDMCQKIMDEQGIKPYSIGITGTDGKSTVTWIIAETLRQILPEYNVHITGNFDDAMGKTILDIVKAKQQGEKHIFVVECSSFMLYPTKTYHFDIGIRTNFAPDHLNWHPNMEEYFAAKQHIISNSDSSYTTQEIYDKLVQTLQAKTKIYNTQYDLSTTNFVGQHNEKNCALSLQVVEEGVKLLGDGSISEQDIRNAIGNVQPLKHRMQICKSDGNITRYDDGKSTSAQSLSAALQSFHEPIVVICGGSDKGDSFTHLAPLFKEHTVYGVFLGQTAGQFDTIFNDIGVSHDTGHSMQECVDLAWKGAKEHNAKVILFSPGCASFDMFKNYEDRAQQYLAAISQI